MPVPAFILVPPHILDEPARSRPLGLFGRLIDAVRGAIADSNGAGELAVMDDRMLADIGLERADLPLPSRPHYDFLR